MQPGTEHHAELVEGIPKVELKRHTEESMGAELRSRMIPVMRMEPAKEK